MAPHPVLAASDNAATVSFVQRHTAGMRAPHAGRMETNSDVRQALRRLLDERGPGASIAMKVQAHTTEEELLVGRCTNGHLRAGNERADGAAKCALAVHGPLLADFSRILAQRGWLYIRFLRELARLFVRVAREVQAALVQATQSEAPLHPTIFGRKRMLRPVAVELRRHTLGDDGAAGDILFSLGQGPLWPSRWAQHEAFCGHLRDFWQSLPLRPRPRGQQGTAWMEAWIIFEMRYGGCPASHRPGVVAGPLDARPTARVRLRHFM